MQVKYFKALWGMEGTPLPKQLERIAEAGYDGFEGSAAVIGDPDFNAVFRSSGLEFIPMVFVETAEQLFKALEPVADLGVTLVNAHSGRDWYSFDEGCRYFEGALEAEQKFGFKIAHETHRGRTFYNPWVTAAYLQKYPELKITADFSHWTNVCESLLQDRKQDLDIAISRAHHLHARVGHENGPQVNDPRTPENERYVKQFEQWWDAIREAHLQRGETVMYVDPEFGPPSYMPSLPFSQVPVTNLWDICQWMADRLRTRWAASPNQQEAGV